VAKRDFAQTRDGLKIRYEIRGDGDPLVLIMGFSGSGRAWSEAFLAPFEKRFQLVVVDNRGTGESDKPDIGWTLGDMAADIAAVMDHARIPKSHVMGISMGGMIAQEYVLAYPNRVKGLVLGCTNCGVSRSIPARPEDLAKLMPRPDLPPAEAAKLAFSGACGKAFQASASGQKFLDDQIVEMGKYPITPIHTFGRQGAAIQGFESFARLGQIKTPTLIIHGDDDVIIPVGNAEVLKRGIQGSRVHILKGAGHMFFWEASEEAVKSAGDFLASVN